MISFIAWEMAFTTSGISIWETTSKLLSGIHLESTEQLQTTLT
jgi:hypothetical protein